MKFYDALLYDDIGNVYERKNGYLKELSALQAAYKEEKTLGNLEKIRDFKKAKAKHPWILARQKFLKAEIDHRIRLDKMAKEFKMALPNDLTKRMKDLKTKLFISQENKDFYEAFQEGSYDAEFAYEAALVELQLYPVIIEHLKTNEKALKKAQYESRRIKDEEHSKANAAIADHKIELQMAYDERVNRLEGKLRDGSISEKNLKDGVKEAKLRYDEALEGLSYEKPGKRNKKAVGNCRVEMNKTFKADVNSLKADVADLRRKIPYESD